MSLSYLEDLLDDPISLEMSLERELGTIADWFKHNFYCGLDVYSKPFNQERGFAIVSGARHKVLVYTIDKLDGLWGDLSEFLGLDLKCTRINETRLKGSREQELQSRIRMVKLSQKIIDKAFDSKYVRHFWSTEDIIKFKGLYADLD
ncbi:putative capsular polysaccharide synthesis family protein [Cyanobium sp. ATX-6F1]